MITHKAFAKCAAGTLLGASLFLMTGCGGNGAGGAVRDNPYATNYAGQVSDSAGNFSSVSLSVSSRGVIAGASVLNGVSTSLNGVLRNGGASTITATGGSTGTVAGTFSSPNASTISAVLTDTPFTKTEYMILLVNPTTAVGGGNAFAGDFGGTYNNSTQSKTGPLCLAIDATGNVTGTILVNLSSTPEFAEVAGSVTSGGAITFGEFVNNVNVGSANGTITLTSGQIAGTITSGTGDSLVLSLGAIQTGSSGVVHVTK